MVDYLGAALFGFVVGWITYRTLRRTTGATHISDLASVIGAIGGGGIVSLFQQSATLLAYYGIGLFAGFFGYLLVGGVLILVRNRAQKDAGNPPAAGSTAAEVDGWLGTK
ncbi:MAG: hypothetical protein ACYDEY_14420 [Acidimicrobiales bacterium]